MRQSFRDRREHLHRGIRTPRLTTMFLMLAILGLVFMQLRNVNNWRMFGSGDEEVQVVPQPASAKTTSAKTTAESADATVQPPGQRPKGETTSAKPKAESAQAEPSGPTDLDPNEMEDIKPSLSVIYDGSLETKPVEQPAYFRILEWVDHQSFDALRKRAKQDFFFDTLIHSPDSMRLQIVEVKLNVLQVVQVMGVPSKDGHPQPLLTEDGGKIYEVRGNSAESGSNLYFGVVVDLPPGTPIGPSVNFEARLVGYFFKVQGYITKLQQLDFEASRTKKVVPLKSPLIIGRLMPLALPVETTASNTPVGVLVTVGGVAIIVLVGWIIWTSRRKRPLPRPLLTGTRSIDPDAPDVDSWLDQAQSGRFTGDPLVEPAHSDGASLVYGDRFTGSISGNIFGSNGESKFDESSFGGRAINGHGPGEYRNGSTGQDPEVRETDDPNH